MAFKEKMGAFPKMACGRAPELVLFRVNRRGKRSLTILPGMWAGLISRVVFAGFLAGTAACAQNAKPTGSAADIKRADQLFRSGSAAFAAGDLSTAHKDFAGLVRLMPRISTAHTAYGVVLLAEGQLPAAVTELETARSLDPNDVRAAINLGLAYRRLDQNEKSVQAFSSIANRPDAELSTTEAVLYAGALAATGDAARAQTVIDEALKRDPNSAPLQDALGALLAQADPTPPPRRHLSAPFPSMQILLPRTLT